MGRAARHDTTRHTATQAKGTSFPSAVQSRATTLGLDGCARVVGAWRAAARPWARGACGLGDAVGRDSHCYSCAMEEEESLRFALCTATYVPSERCWTGLDESETCRRPLYYPSSISLSAHPPTTPHPDAPPPLEIACRSLPGTIRAMALLDGRRPTALAVHTPGGSADADADAGQEAAR